MKLYFTKVTMQLIPPTLLRGSLGTGVICASTATEIGHYHVEGVNDEMNLSTKRLFVVLVVVLVILFVQVPSGYSTESTAFEKTFTFLNDVAMLDTAQYNAKLEIYNSYPVDVDGVVKEEAKYTLTSAESTVNVICRFRSNILVYCEFRSLEGSLLYDQTPPINMLDAAKGLIQRYQNYSGATYLQTMREMLDQVIEMEPTVTTSGNIMLKISKNGAYTYIDWIYTVNDLEVSRNRVHFTFHDGVFESFRDDWNLYEIGSTDLKLSQEEAIRIAREHAQNYSWSVGNITVTDFKILDSPVSAELSMQLKEDNTLCPWWDVRLILDKVYPGMIKSIQVTLWADTGEVTHVEAISTGGTSPEDSTGQTGLDLTPIILAVAIVLGIIIGATGYRRKRTATKHQ